MILLIDGSSYLFRAFFVPALAELTAPDGTPTGAVLGTVRSIEKLLSHYQPTHCAVVFDPRGKTRRHAMRTDYKANRPPTPPSLKAQFVWAEKLLRAKGLAVVQVEGEEADDVIATLNHRLKKANGAANIVIATGDKDLAQLVDESTMLTDIKKNEVVVTDSAAVVEKYGVEPRQIADYLALIGDSVDNIAGVPGVGPKTAAKWLAEFGDIAGIQAGSDLIKGKVGESLRANMAGLFESRTLTEAFTDVACDAVEKDLVIREENAGTLQAIHDELGFRAHISEAPKKAEVPRAVWLDKARFFDDYPEGPWFVAMPLSAQKSETALFADTDADTMPCVMGHYDPENRQWYCALAAPPYESRTPIYMWDSKALAHALDWSDIPESVMDVEILAKCRMGGELARVQADISADIGDGDAAWQDAPGKPKKGDAPDAEAVKVWAVVRFAALRALIVRMHEPKQEPTHERAHERMHGRNQKGAPSSLYADIEKPLTRVLYGMERAGVLLDIAALRAQDAAITAAFIKEEAAVQAIAGEAFNLDSPKQLGEVLFDKLALPHGKRTKSGAASTNEAVLQGLADQGYAIAKHLLQYRMLRKLSSTYTKGLQKYVSPDVRVRTTFHQMKTTTGRLSSAAPNLQNIPIKTELGKQIRKAFVARPGCLLLALDYSQIELRILAHASNDTAMREAFLAGVDIHRNTAARVFGIAPDAVKAHHRRSAKAINFGLIYGMGAFSLAKQLAITRQQAEAWMAAYFEQYPSIKDYLDTQREFAERHGYVETLFGRRIDIADINSSNAALKAHAGRAAINAPIQGAAADVIKRAMVLIDAEIWNDADIRLVLQVHDELVFEVAEDAAANYQARIAELMQSVAPLNAPFSVPLVVEGGAAANWYLAH